MMVASTPDTVSPVADQAEALQVPCVSNDCPWQPYFFGRGGDPAVGFTWTYHAFWGLEDVTAVFTGMWDQLKTNKKVGAMWPNDADGLGWADPKTGQPPMLKAAGYTVVDGGRFQDGTEDYTPQISKFKSADCDILSGVFIPPDFVNFWKQSLPAGLQACRRHRRQGAALPGRDGGDRRHRLRPHHRVLVVPVASRSSRRSPARPARSSPTPGRPAPASSGTRRCCTTRSSRSSSTRSSAPRTSTTSRPSSTPSRRPTWTRSRVTSPGRPAPR